MSEQERMAAINRAVAEKIKKNKPKPVENISCPVDPAERALCEGCQ